MPRYGHDDQFVAVFVERILAEPVFERLDRARGFLKVFFGRLTLVIKHPVIEIQFARFAFVLFREINVVADVDVDAVVVDRVGDLPVIRLGLVGCVMLRFR